MCQLPLSGGQCLRLLDESDIEVLHELVVGNRDHLARWLPWASAQSLQDTAAFVARTRVQVAANDGFQVAIVEGAEMLGMVGFTGVSWRDRATAIGYWLAEPAQGRGTMTAAVARLVDHAFSTWGLHRVEIRAAVENVRSRALAERLGFSQEGILRECERIGERYVDQAVYGMLADGWPGGS